MRKIATTTELQSALQSILTYAQGNKPSRTRIAKALDSLSSRVAGWSYGIESMSVVFTEGRKLAPFNIDVIREINSTFVSVAGDDGEDHEDGALRFLDSEYSGPLTHYDESQGKRHEVRVDVQYPEGAERETLIALNAIGKKFGFSVKPCQRGYNPQTVQTNFIKRTRPNKRFPFNLP